MKHYFSVFAHHRIVLIILLFHAALHLYLPISSSAANDIDAGEELISLTVKDEPLGDVLYKVSVATGYDINLDDKWQNYRVTASFEEISLHKGLKRILKNLNSAIIYVSNKKIKIIIYDKTVSVGTSLPPSTDQSVERTPVSQRQSYRPSDHRPPTSQVIENEDSSGIIEKPSDNAAVSDQESEISSPDNEDSSGTIEKPSDNAAVSDQESETSPPDNEETDENLEDKSAEGSPVQNNQSESKNE